MVKVTLPDGTVFHEPPYTWEEQLEIARRMNGGVVSFSRVSPRPNAAPLPAPAEPQPPPPPKAPSK
jgi:hypothetical protein